MKPASGYYISKNYNNPFTASSKAKLDAEVILKEYGYLNLGLSPSTIDNYLGTFRTFVSNLIGIIRMPLGKIVLFQFPQHNLGWKFKLAKLKRNKNVILIHDINYLRFKRKKDLKYLKHADYLICHNNKMKEWLVKEGINKEGRISCLELFDYIANPMDSEISIPGFDKKNIRIAFVGNLAKSAFLNQCHFDFIKLKLFGIKGDNLNFGKGVEYSGCYHPEDLHKHLDSNFGLIWDGDSTENNNGILGEYLRYISPHKLSMYLSAGLPVIVSEESAVADFVKDHKIGITINSLQEIESKLLSLSEEEYRHIKNNVSPIRKKVLEGYFLKKALKEMSTKISED